MKGWEQLLVKRFVCGHEKIQTNTWKAGKYTRCKRCTQRRKARR